MTTYFVRTSGNNGNSGADKDNAWATITYALTQVSDGDSLIVGGGSYSETPNMSSVSNVRLLGDILGYKTGDAGHVEVLGLTTGPGCHVEFVDSGASLIIGDDRSGFVGCITTSDLIISDGVSNCYALSCGVGDAVVATNPIELKLINLTILGAAAGASVIIDSTTDVSSISLTNSIIIAPTAEYFLEINIPTSMIYFDNNIYWGNGGGYFATSDIGETFSSLENWQYTGQDLNSRFVDPGLTSFAIDSTSPAFDASSSDGVPIDVYGTPRFLGSYDIGCYELSSDKPLPTYYTQRRFRHQYPLESAHYRDSLAEIQRFLSHYFGMDAHSDYQVNKGLVRTMLENIEDLTTSSESSFENRSSDLDNILGNILSLRRIEWK